MAEMSEKDIEQLERMRRRIKRQNEHIKSNYDRITCTVPIGTKERIAAAGESINGLVNRLLAQYFEVQENRGKK